MVNVVQHHTNSLGILFLPISVVIPSGKPAAIAPTKPGATCLKTAR